MEGPVGQEIEPSAGGLSREGCCMGVLVESGTSDLARKCRGSSPLVSRGESVMLGCGRAQWLWRMARAARRCFRGHGANLKHASDEVWVLTALPVFRLNLNIG